MVRTVKAKTARSLNKGERAVLLPGPTGAEPWEIWVIGGKTGTECIQTCASPLDNRLRKNTTLALPVSQVFCLPLWLNETDSKQFAGMIPLQLELRGLQPRGNVPAIFDWSIVAQEGTRTLIVVAVLPASLPPELQVEAYADFDLSARYLPFPENTLTLWQEQDRLAVTMTRGPHLVYFQALAEGQITQRVLQDLNCVRTALTMQGVLPPLEQVMLWAPVSQAELTALRAALPFPLQMAERPSPRQPSPAWKLTPAAVGEAKKNRELRRWRTRGIWIALALYLVVVVCMASRFFITNYRVNELHRWHSEHAQAISLVRDTEAAWKELRPVVDENHYPLELLLHASESLPTDQLHLTLFAIKDDNLMIDGEAKNAQAAFQFLDNLKKDSHFTDYTWDMGQPSIFANDLAKLRITGTRQ